MSFVSEPHQRFLLWMTRLYSDARRLDETAPAVALAGSDLVMDGPMRVHRYQRHDVEEEVLPPSGRADSPGKIVARQPCAFDPRPEQPVAADPKPKIGIPQDLTAEAARARVAPSMRRYGDGLRQRASRGVGQGGEQNGYDAVRHVLEMLSRPVGRRLDDPTLRTAATRLGGVAGGPAKRTPILEDVGSDR